MTTFKEITAAALEVRAAQLNCEVIDHAKNVVLCKRSDNTFITWKYTIADRKATFESGHYDMDFANGCESFNERGAGRSVAPMQTVELKAPQTITTDDTIVIAYLTADLNKHMLECINSGMSYSELITDDSIQDYITDLSEYLDVALAYVEFDKTACEHMALVRQLNQAINLLPKFERLTTLNFKA